MVIASVVKIKVKWHGNTLELLGCESIFFAYAVHCNRIIGFEKRISSKSDQSRSEYLCSRGTLRTDCKFPGGFWVISQRLEGWVLF